MYQSLHTTIIGPSGKPVELQIRTHAMHRTAEYGIAAHWKYKEQKKVDVADPGLMSDEMGWLRQIVDWQKEMQEPGEFLDSLRYDLASSEVYVFTPKGDVVALPSGATPVDFAYAVHTEVGHRCIGARVNGKLVALESPLDNGDTVEVFTSKAEAAGPSRDWLGFVKSPRARNKIKQWFARERREDAIEAGKTALSKAMRKAALPQRVLAGDQLLTLAKDMHLLDVAALYAAIGDNHVSAQSVVQKLVAQLGGAEGAVEDIAEAVVPTVSPPAVSRPSGGNVGVVVKGVSDVWVKLARCCTPVPGDDILGFVTRGGGVSVHRRACTNATVAARPGRPARRGRVGAVGGLDLRRVDPGRGLRPARAALRHHPGAVRRAGQHPDRVRVDEPRPGRGQHVHLRDGRGQAPRAPAARDQERRRRLRRAPPARLGVTTQPSMLFRSTMNTRSALAGMVGG